MAIFNFADHLTSGFDEDALATTTPGEQVFNFGSLTTTGNLAEGIFAAADDVTIRNFGSVETNGLGAGGILVRGEDARIANHGSVITKGGFLDPAPEFGDEVFSEGIVAVGDRFHIANHGDVRVEGKFSSAMAGIGADGIVVNRGRVECLSSSGVIAAIGDRSQAINAGKVTTSNVDATALVVIGEDALALNLDRIEMSGTQNIGIRVAFVNARGTNAGAIRIDADDGVGMLGLGNAHQLSNFGLIEMDGGFGLGIAAAGGPPGTQGLDFDIVNAGSIVTEGDVGIGISIGVTPFGYRSAHDGMIVNRGAIATNGDGAAAVFMVGDGHHLDNSGRVRTNGGAFDHVATGLLSAAGVIVSGDDALVENARTGLIRSGDPASAAVEMNIIERDGLIVAETSTRLENLGTIKGAGLAVLGGAGEETVINRGRIVGDIDLCDGADTLVFGKGGTISGLVSLGTGDDLIRVKNGAGDAELADFVAGDSGGDVADVSSFFASFGELVSEAVQAGDDVAIDLDHNDRLVLKDVELGDLNAGDFLFA